MLIVEARNAKFLEDGNISGSQQPLKIILEEEWDFCLGVYSITRLADQIVNLQPVNQDGIREGRLADRATH